jgi:hypothetical protein
MLAALQQERLVKKAPKRTGKGKPKSTPKKLMSVPGSWKQASIRWHWVERAAAFDEDKITHSVELMFDDLYESTALAFNRIMTLRNLNNTILEDFNLNRAHMTPDQKLGYYARMTKILENIANEMKVFDAPTQWILVRREAYKQYCDFKSPTTPDGFAQLVERAGGAEKLGKALAEEKARRKELEHNKKAFERAAALE